MTPACRCTFCAALSASNAACPASAAAITDAASPAPVSAAAASGSIPLNRDQDQGTFGIRAARPVRRVRLLSAAMRNRSSAAIWAMSR